jgi:hypothetical protein
LKPLKWTCSWGIKKLASISTQMKINAMVAVIYASSPIAENTSIKWEDP